MDLSEEFEFEEFVKMLCDNPDLAELVKVLREEDAYTKAGGRLNLSALCRLTGWKPKVVKEKLELLRTYARKIAE